jgi:hypothetical protein
MDGVLETLLVTNGPTVAIVTSCNSTFSNGLREALVNWMRREEESLRHMRPEP